MKKLFIVLAIVLFATFAYAQPSTVEVIWEYDAVEAERVDKWMLFMSTTSGGPYTKLMDIDKVGDQNNYEETISTDTIPNQMMYFVLVAVDLDVEPDLQNSEDSNEASFDFTPPTKPPAAFNLILRLVLEE